MQKALTEMNIQLHNVIRNITGITGTAIINAILAGERDPVKLAKLRNNRIQSSEDVIAKSLNGDYFFASSIGERLCAIIFLFSLCIRYLLDKLTFLFIYRFKIILYLTLIYPSQIKSWDLSSDLFAHDSKIIG